MRTSGIGVVCFIATLTAAAQQDTSGPTFSAGIRLVEVDVVARSKGAPATGLSKDDFTLLDNGKPEKISFFSVRPARISGPAASVPLPAGVVSNRPARGGAALSNTTVLLIDQKNTPQAVQAFAIQRVVKFVQTRRKADRIGIYTFGKDGRLQAVQEITDDGELLSRAASTLKPRDPTYRNLDTGGMTAPAAEGFLALEFRERGLDTKYVLEAIARHLAKVPGRKSLVWVTTSFPLYNLELGIDFRPDMDEAARLLNDANVALYAVDAHGLIGALAGLTIIPNAESAGPQSQAQLRMEMGRGRGGNIDPFDAPGAGLNTMNMLADLTGGLVFYNKSNAIEDSIRTAVDDGDLIYTLGFYPAQTEQDGAPPNLHSLPSVHTLKVVVARRGVNVRYRENYLAARAADSANGHPELQQVLGDSFDATQLGVTAQATPDQARADFLQVKVNVDVHGLSLEHSNGRRVGMIDVSFHVEGSRTVATKTLKIDMPDGQFAAYLEKGIDTVQSVDTTGRTQALRVVVQDRTSGATGSVTLALGKR